MKVMVHEKSARQTHPGPEEGNAEATAASQGIYKPGCEMLRFAAGIDKLDTPDEVLDRLHQVAFKTYKVSVLGAMLLPARWGDWSDIELGKTVFLHKSAPKDWWGEWRELSQCHPGPGITLAHVALAPFTHTELMQKLEPLGIDRWPIELALKHGMRDGLTCPVGGAGWSHTGLRVCCPIVSPRRHASCSSWAPHSRPFVCKGWLDRTSAGSVRARR
jgi:hypothetical protein